MKRLLRALWATCLLASPAFAIDIDPSASLQNCASDASISCKTNREQMGREWPKALAGDYQSQRNLAYCLEYGCGGAVRTDRIAGCAWRIVILASGSDKLDTSDNSNFRSACRQMGNIDLAAAKVFAGQIFAQVYRRTIPPPPWEWLPPVASINVHLGPDGKSALGMVKVALRMAFQCPGAKVDQNRTNAILARLGVKDSAIPGSIYDAAAVAAEMERNYPGYRSSQSAESAASICGDLEYNYGRSGLYLPGLAVVPMPERYPPERP